MKKIIISILALCGIAHIASAQDAFTFDLGSGPQEQKVDIRIGIVGSLNMSMFSVGDPQFDAGFGVKPGIDFGAAANFRFLKRSELSTVETGVLAFQPELKFSSIGARYDKGAIGLNYLMVPLMFQVYPTDNFYLELGPQLALNLSSTPDNVALNKYQINLENLKANDVMIALGAGYSTNGFSAGIRYCMGCSPIASNLPLKNNVIQVNLGYKFQIKKKQSSTMQINL